MTPTTDPFVGSVTACKEESDGPRLERGLWRSNMRNARYAMRRCNHLRISPTARPPSAHQLLVYTSTERVTHLKKPRDQRLVRLLHTRCPYRLAVVVNISNWCRRAEFERQRLSRPIQSCNFVVWNIRSAQNAVDEAERTSVFGVYECRRKTLSYAVYYTEQKESECMRRKGDACQLWGLQSNHVVKFAKSNVPPT